MKMTITTALLTTALCLAANGSFAKGGPNGGLPPGLEKKHENGQALPPGWQKKLAKGQILDESIYLRGRVISPLGRDGSISISVEGTILRLHEKTRRILDILH